MRQVTMESCSIKYFSYLTGRSYLLQQMSLWNLASGTRQQSREISTEFMHCSYVTRNIDKQSNHFLKSRATTRTEINRSFEEITFNVTCLGDILEWQWQHWH